MSKATRSNSISGMANILDESILETVINKLAPKLTATIEAQLENLGKQFEQMDSKINNIVNKLDDLDKLAHFNQRAVTKLSENVDFLEQRSKMNTLRVVGMKEENNENLQARVLLSFNDGLEIKCTLDDINNVFRIRKVTENIHKSRPVIVDFVSYLKRNEIYKGRSALKGTEIYLNEDLTEQRYQLMTLSRKKYGTQNVWSRNRRIYFKVGNSVKIINKELDI
ncbi:unnamed protein product [Phaedon cochleariae]|uniref:Uncharacterized protein n=1 Tax=Phaedon cochleariae TaxID=80249 RepID=A0A9N9X7E5_PHACE|nr:unnamed protein product [Phaedon cochleariae]